MIRHLDQDKKRLRKLELIILAWHSEVEKTLSEIKERHVRLSLNRRDQIRLLNLKVWTVRYRISLRSILDVLLAAWSKKQYGGGLLGVRIATLCGVASRTILEKHVKELYPAGEQYASHRCESILSQLKPLKKSKWPDPSRTPVHFIQYYRRQASQNQREFSKAFRSREKED